MPGHRFPRIRSSTMKPAMPMKASQPPVAVPYSLFPLYSPVRALMGSEETLYMLPPEPPVLPKEPLVSMAFYFQGDHFPGPLTIL